MGETRERHFDGTNFEPRKVPKNAQTPTSQVHAVLGGDVECEMLGLTMDFTCQGFYAQVCC